MPETPPEQEPSSHIIEEAGETSPHDERVAELIEHTIDVPVLAEAVEQQEAPDAADTLETLAEEEAADVLEQMDDRAAAEALAEMRSPLAAGVMQDLVDEELAYAGRLLQIMAPDDAADLLQAMEPSYREEALAAVPLASAAALRKLVGYDRESAGGMMTTDYVALRQDMTVGEATEIIRGQVVPEDVQHLLVVDDDGRLVGIIGFRDLLLSGPGRRIGDLMYETVKAVRTGVDREAVAREFDRYDYAMLPVVDLDDRLIGIVTVD
ncbi:MAG: CBS domain-containing protein, partial [Planctomycetota bacterium]